MTWIVLSLVLTIVAGCGPPPGRLFHTTITSPDGGYPLPVTLGDQTELVIAIEPATYELAAEGDLSVRSDPSDPNVLVLTWLGSACTDSADVSFRRDGDRYPLSVFERGGFLASCPAIALGRALRIKTSQPVSTDQIDVIGSE